MDFVEICNVCARKVIIEVAKRIINSDKVCPSYSDLNFGVNFLEHSVVTVEFNRYFIGLHNHYIRCTKLRKLKKEGNDRKK